MAKRYLLLILAILISGSVLGFSDVKAADLSFQLFKGWNLISSPAEEPLTLSEIEKAGNCQDKVWPYKGYKLWGYDSKNGKWSHPSQIKNNEAAWIYVSADCQITLEGEPAQFSPKPLYAGWNLFSTETSWDEIKGDCEIKSWFWREPQLWEWNQKTEKWEHPSLDEKLSQSKGYWVEVKSNCTLSKGMFCVIGTSCEPKTDSCNDDCSGKKLVDYNNNHIQDFTNISCERYCGASSVCEDCVLPACPEPITHCSEGECNAECSDGQTKPCEEIEVGTQTCQTDCTWGPCELPESFDWRNKDGENWLTPVKNQSDCGSCWAFSVVGAMEAKYNIQEDNPSLDIDLSEQYLVSDCYREGSCDAGLYWLTLNYIKKSGITDEACYPYQGRNSSCEERCSDWKERLWKITDSSVVFPERNTMKRALIEKGPLIVYINMKGWNPETYTCSLGLSNHCVIIIGYNDKEGVWIVKNSWGPSWGDKGYFKVNYEGCNIQIIHQIEGVISP